MYFPSSVSKLTLQLAEPDLLRFDSQNIWNAKVKADVIISDWIEIGTSAQRFPIDRVVEKHFLGPQLFY